MNGVAHHVPSKRGTSSAMPPVGYLIWGSARDPFLWRSGRVQCPVQQYQRTEPVSPPVSRLTSDNTSCLEWVTQTHFKIKLQGLCWSLFRLSIRCRQVGLNPVHCNFHTDSEASYRTDSEGGWDISQCYIWKWRPISVLDPVRKF
jgi:hypothetical protein